jgi:hypothetical protein
MALVAAFVTFMWDSAHIRERIAYNLEEGTVCVFPCLSPPSEICKIAPQLVLLMAHETQILCELL